MNLANKLTLLRVILVPFFLLFMYLDMPFITDFGKFLDPLADKVLVMAALAVFVELDEVKMSAIPFIIITAREFMVSGLRLLAADSGIVVAAGMWGKLKTAFTMVTIVGIIAWLTILYNFSFGISESVQNTADIVISVFIWISTILTIISGGIYLKAYWHLIDSDK